MDNRVRCVLWEVTTQVQIGLRRYVSSEKEKCVHPDNKHGYHQAMVYVDVREATYTEDGYRTTPTWDQNDPRWPTHCMCGYDLSNEWKQTFGEILYRNTETGELLPQSKFPIGAMWDDKYLGRKAACSVDGKSLHVKLPDETVWCIDGRASNCTMPQDMTHKCWIRHGEPPVLTVDKKGHTCAAGAGSIVGHRGYHGFLIDGYLTNC